MHIISCTTTQYFLGRHVKILIFVGTLGIRNALRSVESSIVYCIKYKCLCKQLEPVCISQVSNELILTFKLLASCEVVFIAERLSMRHRGVGEGGAGEAVAPPHF